MPGDGTDTDPLKLARDLGLVPVTATPPEKALINVGLDHWREFVAIVAAVDACTSADDWRLRALIEPLTRGVEAWAAVLSKIEGTEPVTSEVYEVLGRAWSLSLKYRNLRAPGGE